MLPGCGTTDLWLFEPQLADQRLNDRYNMVAIETRSQGQTTGPINVNATLEDNAYDLAVALDTLGWPPYHLMGEGATGCLIALRLTILRPQRVLSLLLISPPFLEAPPENRKGLIELRDAFMENKNGRGDGSGELPAEAINGFLTYLQSNYSAMTQRARVASTFETLFGAGRPAEAILEHFDPLINRTPIPKEALASITQPVLILHGSEDAAAPTEAAETLKNLLSGAAGGADLRIVHGAPNQLTFTHHGFANRFIARFLEYHAPSKPFGHPLE